MKELNLDHAVEFAEMFLQEIESYLQKEKNLTLSLLISQRPTDPRKGMTRLAARYLTRREEMERIQAYGILLGFG